MPRQGIFWGILYLAAVLGGHAQTPPTTPLSARMMWMEADDYYQSHGELSRARQILENARQYLREQGKAEAIDYINPTGRLAKLSARLGDFDRASALYDEAAALVGKLRGPESIENARVKNQQATMLYFAKRYADAETRGREGLAIAERARGLEDIEVANAAAIAGMALGKQTRYEEAEALLERTLAIYRKKRGPDDAYTRLARFNLAQVYLSHGRVADAREMLQQSGTTTLLGSRSSLDDMEIIRGLTVLALTEGNLETAREHADQLFAAQLHFVRDIFPDMVEEERLRAKSQLDLLHWYGSIGDSERIARAVLQTKAITLDAVAPRVAVSMVDAFAPLVEPRNIADGFKPISAELFAVLHPAAPAPKSDTSDPIAPARSHLYSLTPAQVVAALPVDAAIIEFVRYEHQLGGYRSEPRYGALLFLPKTESAAATTAWIPLGVAAPIDREIGALLQNVGKPLAGVRVPTALRALGKSVWAPIAARLPATIRQVFLCPDDTLCFVPFAALLGPDDAFLAEKHTLVYLSTARDLFQPRWGNKKKEGGFAIFAAPDFDGHPGSDEFAAAVSFRDVEARSLAELQLRSLPGARREAETLAGIARRHGFTPVLFVGAEATEGAVRRLDKPKIVHFATHGFILDLVSGSVPANPMERAGLALCGAQLTLAALAKSAPTMPRETDGILTAREVMGLKLQGTWLVTLAACDSGQGETRDGESVLGLRRGFLAAGVENLLLSLWRLPDVSTAEFMRAFYDRALASGDPATALAGVQREWLVRARRERGIAHAVAEAGPFVLNSTGHIVTPDR